MEYYIYNLYKEKKNKDDRLKNSGNAKDKWIENTMRILFVILLISCIVTIMMIGLRLNIVITTLSLIIMLITIIGLFVLYNYDEKKNVEKHIETHITKVDILYDIITNRYNINTKEKVNELINMYESVIEKKENEEKRKSSLIKIFMSGYAGVMSISFANMSDVGLTLDVWIGIAVIISLYAVAIASAVYVPEIFDSTKKKYTRMVKDLNDILLIRY